jgi:hypothetical protein
VPWEVRKQGADFVVVVTEGPKKGKVAGRHSTREKALAQVRALYANTGEGGGHGGGGRY